MKTATKIKGILAMADITQGELASLCGVTRQTIHNYLNVVNIEDYTHGITVIDTVDKLMRLCGDDSLPFPHGTLDKMAQIRALLERD